MMVHELKLGVPDDDDSGLWQQGVVTALSFWIFGAIPVVAFALADAFEATSEIRFIVDCIVTLLALGALGALAAKVSGIPPVMNGLKMMVNGGMACSSAYLIAWGLAEAMGGVDVLCLGPKCDHPVSDAYRFNNAPWVPSETAVPAPDINNDDQFWDCSSRSGVDEQDSDSNVLYTRVNLFSGEVGNYEFMGYSGASPEITVEIGKTYLFDQTHHTNWYHPLGFGFDADGAHGLSWGAEARDEIDDEYTRSNGNPAVQYRINKVQPEGNLEDYEPQFLWPRAEWLERRYGVEITITDEIARHAAEHGGIIYYFCHLHSKMSGKLRITGNYQKDGSAYQKTKSYEKSSYAPHGTELNEYVPRAADAFDSTCGTYEASPYKIGSGMCPGQQFLCSSAGTTFEQCMHAIDCKMQVEMTVKGHDVHQDPVAIFMQQMIPHHTNAVNMARVMLKTGYTRSDAFANNLMYEIVNNQNKQIHEMRNYLADRRHQLPPAAACEDLEAVYARAGMTMEYPGTTAARG
jgi:hypothetical protein